MSKTDKILDSLTERETLGLFDYALGILMATDKLSALNMVLRIEKRLNERFGFSAIEIQTKREELEAAHKKDFEEAEKIRLA